MPTFGEQSLRQLATVHPDLRRVLEDAIRYTDFRVLCGHRGEQEQNAAVANGASKLRWPKSMHNSQPSMAADLLPWPFDYGQDWKDLPRFARMMGHVESAAKRLGVKIRLGIDWDRDGKTIDETFRDYPHVELDLG